MSTNAAAGEQGTGRRRRRVILLTAGLLLVAAAWPVIAFIQKVRDAADRSH
jgi:hypothetical protein